MPFCVNLTVDVCGVPIRNAVGFAFCHLFIHGIFVTAFVFSNEYYPPLYYVDYLFGLSGTVLIAVSTLGYIIASSRSWQPIRSIWAILVVLNVLTVSVGAIYYTIERWDDVVTTAFVGLLRKPGYQDFPDDLWYASTVIACIMILPFLLYLIYITSFMCNEWDSNLFPETYAVYPGAVITVPQISPSPYYPTQR